MLVNLPAPLDHLLFECGGALSNLSYVAPVTGTYVLRAGCFSSSACSGTVG